MSRGILRRTDRTSYGGIVIRSDLALAALATAAVPGMRPVLVAALRATENHPTYQSALVEDMTGRRWVVRAPLVAAAGAVLEGNDELVRHLGKHLPFKVPAAAGYADLGPDGRAAVYPYVEGQGLNLRHLPTGPGLASAVGRAIAAVHNMPRELYEECGAPVFDAAQCRSRKLAELDRAAETGHVPNGLLARWEQALDTASLWDFGTVPTHGSLAGSSFLVAFSDDDAASGRVVGLTGWERAQVADPAEDFARLVERSHPHAVDVVLESYAMARSQRPDQYLLQRARLISEMRLLPGLMAALGSEDHEFVRARADDLRKLDRLTANDDSLVPSVATPPATATSDATGSGTDTTAQLPPADTASLSTTPGPPGHGPQSAAMNPEGDEEPAFVVEQPADGGRLEPVHRDGQDEPASDGASTDESEEHLTAEEGSDESVATASASPADVTAPIPRFRPVPSTDEAAETAPVDQQQEGSTAQEAAEQERLHTLYGMPDAPTADGDDPTPQAPTTDQDDPAAAGPGTDLDDATDEPTEPEQR